MRGERPEDGGVGAAQVEFGEQEVLPVLVADEVDPDHLLERLEGTPEGAALDGRVVELLELADLDLTCNVKVLLVVTGVSHICLNQLDG